MKEYITPSVKGKIYVIDIDENKIIKTTNNAIHTQNMSVAIARSLAHIPSGPIYQMVFGRGGHDNLSVKKTPNVTNWNSEQYEEVYSEVVDGTLNYGGGNGTNPKFDDHVNLFSIGPGCTVVENESGCTLYITCIMNKFEPMGQDNMDTDTNTSTIFEFDEISLYTLGTQLTATKGYQNIILSQSEPYIGYHVTDSCGLRPNTQYSFSISVNGLHSVDIIITTGSDLVVTIQQLIDLINDQFVANNVDAEVFATDFTAQPIVNTFGKLKFSSKLSGSSSSLILTNKQVNGVTPLFTGLVATIETPVNGTDAGLRSDPANYSKEARRMLTHLIFDEKIKKSANKKLKFVYELKIQL